jgi:hypothetical protein
MVPWVGFLFFLVDVCEQVRCAMTFDELWEAIGDCVGENVDLRAVAKVFFLFGENQGRLDVLLSKLSGLPRGVDKN